mmetsp:Transcript_15517/g.37124  ORF Transcript_15517/g.37124 Transcript_15517/m.37124 type:complete len:217 (-) Transcript_15517:74-724(-)|eukprot:CAMPEP_0185812002 /NCGR_PEP_ID=MMETSP1322-20130828/8816_1 /TAXON_ID=265543 /ORGANISM="Minutocellus polymorphus, Strain RCC2270" /LENGTH=216 /DNA_ID=CAMNT_0028508505 /DNA_START=11 /DNA_END=661 /DNA_ORIENTATION=-
MKRSISIPALLLLAGSAAEAFVAPRALSLAARSAAAGPLGIIAPVDTLVSTASVLLADETGLIRDLAPAAAADAAAAVDTDSLLSGLRTFFGVLTALVFGAFGLTYFVAAFIVPKAAEQLEADTRRLRPGLWEEYETKLEAGQTMATRPDILQELGEEMRPVILEDFEKSAAQEEANKKAGVVDATIVEEKKMSSSGSNEGDSPSSILETDNQWKD